MSKHETFEEVFPLFYTMVTINTGTPGINQMMKRLKTIIDKEEPKEKKKHLLKIVETFINHSLSEHLAGFPMEIVKTAKRLNVNLEELSPVVEKLPEELSKQINNDLLFIFDLRDDLKEVFDKNTLKKIGVI